MDLLRSLLETDEASRPLPSDTRQALANSLAEMVGMHVYPRSITALKEAVLFLGRPEGQKRLGLLYRGTAPGGVCVSGEESQIQMDLPLTLRLCPTDHVNAAALRRTLPFTGPRLLGIRKSVGLGDRLGLATPGHVQALRKAVAADRSGQAAIAPIFAQQSIREMVRTERTPEQVMDDATWGVFQEGWRQGFGADADHLKTIADADLCADAGFTFYTVDPGDHVDNAASTDATDVLVQKVAALPWDMLQCSPDEMRATYLGRAFDLGSVAVLRFTDETLLRAAAKYSRAVAHTATMYRYLVERMGNAGENFELEVSVDETETPTTPEEHFFIAHELKRLGVRWVSLAPRYVGRFEKGVDYIGDLDTFETDLVRHVAIAQELGPYKLSIHSGSDKFSIYPIISRVAGDLVHLKTAGTSYLEALRAIATISPSLFREILHFARERYAEDKASYHVSAEPRRFPDPDGLADGELAQVLDDFDGRQLVHVTFGSVLTMRDESGGYRFRARLLEALAANEEIYSAVLERHIGRHVTPFCSASAK
jgi:hypothetical protein